MVEDDGEDAEPLIKGLQRHGHEVRLVQTGAEALKSYDRADMMLLDFELPDLDGLEVCRRIRSTSTVPVIAITARGTELDRVLGLQSGADDYLVKPYGFRELMARMEAVMRRVKAHEVTPSVISNGGLRINATTRQVCLDGRRIDLTRKEFDLLYLLASQPNTVFPRKRIMQEVWGGDWSRRTIDTHVSSLRNKLGNKDWILTVRGVGFQLGGV
ncbi:response regulator transcription factor [Streptomyces sp. NPDC001848]|uniref:response regulator transcription factor n=1 Tax=Streptomyces sp. NPDC001848 TaxID=3364618 RepID=UPI00367EBC1E